MADTTTRPPQPKPYLQDSHGDWSIAIYDYGNGMRRPMRVELSLGGVVQKVGLVEGYTVWTLLAHWKDGLPDDR